MPCQHPVHRFPMCARTCECGEISVPEPQFKNITGCGRYRKSIGAAGYIKGYKSPDALFAARCGSDKWQRDSVGAANSDSTSSQEEVRDEDENRAI